MEKELEEIVFFLIENGIATEEEIYLVIKINGYTENTLNNILFARTGYRNVEQYLEE